MRGAGVSLAAASGYFARCDGRVFRALRGATGGAAPWTPRFGLPAARWQAPQTHGWWTALTRKKSSKTFKVWGFLSDLVRWFSMGAVTLSIHASHCCGERAKGPSVPPGGGTWGTGSPECAGHRHPHTARRHTQVPPYIPRRTADIVRRAGPVCPAAGMYRKPRSRLIRSACVGRGLAPFAGTDLPLYNNSGPGFHGNPGPI